MLGSRWGLDDEEERILLEAITGKDAPEIAESLGVPVTGVRHKLSRHIYEKLGARSFSHAVAIYANRLGLTGALLPQLRTPRNPEMFELGHLSYPAVAISSALKRAGDIDFLMTETEYKVPTRFQESLGTLRSETEAAARARNEIVYEPAGNSLLVVNRLEPANEFYCPLRVTLEETRYLTYKAIEGSFTDEEKYRINPRIPGESAAPLGLCVSLIIVAGSGRDTKLIVLRRSSNVGTYQDCLSASIEGWVEGDKDMTAHLGERRLDYAAAMWRELGEERSKLGLSLPQFREKLQLLSFIYDYRYMWYVLVGLLVLPDAVADTIVQVVSKAKEGTYEALEFPDLQSRTFDAPVRRALRAICSRLVGDEWTPHAAISIVRLLEYRLGARRVYPLVGAPFNVSESG